MDDTKIVITYGSYRWEAKVQADGETFLCKEYSGGYGGKPINTYSINENELDDHVLKVLEGSVS